ncbi:MAG: DUF819 family protein [Bacteroidales bacterium]|jgi:uncharacterized membrane protein
MTLLIIFWTLFYLLMPALVVWLCKKISFLGKVGAILTLYFIGITAANLFIFPFEEITLKLLPIQDLITSLTIPLAMSLILLSCNFKNWPLKKSFLSLIFGMLSVLIVVTIGYFIFAEKSGYPEFNKIAGMLIGVYTGGTPNLAALKMMLDVDETTYVLVNSFDMLISFIYLTFLMAIGIKLFRQIMPHLRSEKIKSSEEGVVPGKAIAQSEDELYRNIFTKKNFVPTLKAIGLAIVITAISLGLSLGLTGKINMIILILTITTLSIGFSFLKSVKKMEKSYDIGMYLVLIFSLVVASMVNIRSINFTEGAWILAYISFTIFGSLFLHVILARIFKIDADTTVITSVALINSPLFVPMIADCMKNKKVIITGITIGIIGYAIGNYLGVLIAEIL